MSISIRFYVIPQMLTLEMYLLENRIEIYFVRALVNFKAARITPMHIILAILLLPLRVLNPTCNEQIVSRQTIYRELYHKILYDPNLVKIF